MFTSQSRRFLAISLLYCGFLVAASVSTTQPADSASAAHVPDTYERSPTSRGETVRHFRGSLARVYPLLMRYGYWAAAAATLVEGMGIPMPGQTLLIAASFEAAAGRMNIMWLLTLVTAFAVLGNSLGYAIGYWGGRFVLTKFKVNAQRQRYFEDLFERRGGVVILFGRFVDGLRQLNGIISGVMKMPWWTFTSYNISGALLWTVSWGLGTYYLGRRIHVIAGFFHRHHFLLFALGLAVLLALLFYLPRSARRKENVLV